MDMIGSTQIQLFIIVGLSFACDVMETQLLTFIQGCVKAEWDLSDEIEALLTGMVFLGQIIGMLTLCPLADIYGRRISILLGWFLIVVFGIVSCLSTDIVMLIITRMFVGVGIGASQSVAYDLFAETVPTQYRNRIVYISLFTVVGSEYVIGVGSGSLAQLGWRWLAFFCALPVLCLGIVGIFYLPESPRWLINRGRVDEAEVILKDMAIMNGTEESCGPIVARPGMEIADKTMYDLVAGPLLILSSINWGVWLFSYFAAICLSLVLIDSFSIGDCDFQFGWLALASGVEFFGILFAIQILSYTGRVSMQFGLYIVSSLLLCIYGLIYTYSGVLDAALTMLFLAKMTLSAGTDTTPILSYFPTFVLPLYTFSCTPSYTLSSISTHALTFALLLPIAIAITWVHTVEMFPTELRASAHSLAAIMGRIGAFAAVYWVDDYASVDGNTLLGSIFYVTAAVAAALLVLSLPETSGIKLDTDHSAINSGSGKDSNDRLPMDHTLSQHNTTTANNSIHDDEEGDSDAMNVLPKSGGNRGEEQSLLGKSKKPKNFPLGFK